MSDVESTEPRPAPMPDPLTPAARSALMAAIRGKDTAPELTVRRLAHALGFRFRLHGKSRTHKAGLPGRPDLVFASRRKVIFVHGCFWHRHPAATCPRGRSAPKANARFWQDKFAANVARDRRAAARLRRLGWSVLTVWECQTTPRRHPTLARRLHRFLSGNETSRQDAKKTPIKAA